MLPGQNGVFDPNVSQSGQDGTSIGPYVLNLLAYRDDTAPQVVAVTPSAGTTLDAPPQTLTVQFDEAVNLQQLAFTAYDQTATAALAPVQIDGPGGTVFYPRLVAFDAATNQATFQMLDALPNGAYQLRLSGPLGLADYAGNPLTGNDASGDYVVPLTVAGPVRGTGTEPLAFDDQEPNDTLDQPQILGVLFPHELQAGVTISRDFSTTPDTAPADSADFYQFTVTQAQSYSMLVNGQFPGQPVLNPVRCRRPADPGGPCG